MRGDVDMGRGGDGGGEPACFSGKLERGQRRG